MLIRCAAWLLALSVIAPAPLLATTHYVSHAGSNTYPYDSWATAADTVARAVEAAAEWDTILIAAGHYATDSVRMKRGHVLQGAGPDLTILDSFPAGSVRPIIAEDSCVIRDLRIEVLNAGGIGSVAAAVVFPAMSINKDQALSVKNVRCVGAASCLGASFQDVSRSGRVCLVDSCEFIGFHSAIEAAYSRLDIRHSVFRWDQNASVGVIIADYSELLVEGCQFYGYDPAAPLSSAAAVTTVHSDSVVIRNSLFYSNLRAPVFELNWNDGEVVPVPNGLIENNTVIGFRWQLKIDRSGFVYRNNISMWDQLDASTQAFYDGLVTGTYNLTWQNSPWDSGMVRSMDTIPNDIPGNHDNQNLDPMFDDMLAFYLQAYSPAIDAGDPSIMDADGSRSDIGYTGGPGGFSYAYQDLAPAVPQGFAGIQADTTITFYWRGNHEADLDHYEIEVWGGPNCDSEHCGIFFVSPADSSFSWSSYILLSEYIFIFHIRAVDAQGNASDWSSDVVYARGDAGDDGTVPGVFRLQPNYPNPFNAQTRIEYTLAQPSNVVLTVYDALGRKVETLVQGPQSTGPHSLTWDATGRGSGVYFLVLDTPAGRRVRKAMVLK